ncbi:MAG TPA: S41 family peptidase [Ramlibacter sp.]|uniref:S41 family peptidase n=1 Tax=Ramlibacter sp. TaxID=1917967 RepID=UPI002D493E32|nr:S41 family peptidase [Ramlibacter sp.]HZY18821.1 S41 family peptidase [Ramlibacter sp.]
MSFVVPLRRAACLAGASAALFLTACGGGGGGADAGATPVGSITSLAASSTLANICTPEGQKRWVRSYLNETYLWYGEIRDVEASGYPTVPGYFDALLVRSPDATGQAKDRFSVLMTTTAADAMQGTTSASGGGWSAPASSPVPLVKTLASGSGRKVGYVLFNDHSQGAQDALIGAFTTLRNAGVQDLVLDMRYNPGGFLYVAQAAASMVAGPTSDGQVFESVRYNDKRDADSANGTFWFSPRTLVGETRFGRGTALPQLGLPRVYILTSRLTCSASESIINGLRGIGVQVVLVGDRTCGKPYGFHRKDNCGQSMFAIEFQVYNAQGFGDYASGFPVQCRVAENYTTPLGASSEPLLAAALHHVDTGSCPAGTTGVQLHAGSTGSMFDRPGAPPLDSAMYQPGWNGHRLQ